MIERFIDSFTGARKYLDSNVFIYALEGFLEFAEICRGILLGLDQGLITCTTSELTLAEVLVHPFMKNDAAILGSYRDLVRDQEHLSLRPVTRSILEESARIRAEVGGTLPDAIHVATALAHRCDFFFTGDQALKSPKSAQVVTLRQLNEEFGIRLPK